MPMVLFHQDIFFNVRLPFVGYFVNYTDMLTYFDFLYHIHLELFSPPKYIEKKKRLDFQVLFSELHQIQPNRIVEGESYTYGQKKA